MGWTKSAYLEKKNPVNVRAVYWGKLILSVGRWSSMNDAPLMNHLDMGAQKWTVNGPASATTNIENNDGGGGGWRTKNE